MVITFTWWTIAKIATEAVLGLCIKLFIENGRIHPSDFVNDFLFWVPGVKSYDGHGATRDYLQRYGEIANIQRVEQPSRQVA